MYDRSFFKSKVGRAAVACTAAMCLFVALTTQMQIGPAHASIAASDADAVSIHMVELA